MKSQLPNWGTFVVWSISHCGTSNLWTKINGLQPVTDCLGSYKNTTYNKICYNRPHYANAKIKRQLTSIALDLALCSAAITFCISCLRNSLTREFIRVIRHFQKSNSPCGPLCSRSTRNNSTSLTSWFDLLSVNKKDEKGIGNNQLTGG